MQQRGGVLEPPYVELFVTPGVNHSVIGVTNDGSPVPHAVDLLGVLDAWVTRGKAPGTLLQVAQKPDPPFATVATRPMCAYPAYPRHERGSGTDAISFDCTRGQGVANQLVGPVRIEIKKP